MEGHSYARNVDSLVRTSDLSKGTTFVGLNRSFGSIFEEGKCKALIYSNMTIKANIFIKAIRSKHHSTKTHI